MSTNLDLLPHPVLLEEPSSFPKISRVLAVLVALMGLAGLAGSLAWRAATPLSEEERSVLYVRAKAEFQEVCMVPPVVLKGHCKEKADELAKLPECDSECQKLAASVHPRPVKRESRVVGRVVPSPNQARR